MGRWAKRNPFRSCTPQTIDHCLMTNDYSECPARDGSGSRPTGGGCVNGRARATRGSPDARPVNTPPNKGAKAYSPRGRQKIE